jgi:hypothetical protein
MTFLTNEERLIEAKRLGDIKTLEDKERHREQWEHMGGTGKRSCLNCKDWNGIGCKNAAASLKGGGLKTNRIRYADGLCGPDGVFWTKKPRISKKAKDNIMVFGTIAVLLAGFIAFGVWLVGGEAVMLICCLLLGAVMFCGDGSRY